jgi:lipid A oxidase
MRFTPTLAAFVLLAASAAVPARAEWQVKAYGGYTFTHDSTVNYHSPDSEKIDVEWDGKSFSMPIYYGARLTRWFESNPAWGVQIDFNHIKTYANLDPGTEAGDTFEVLEFTDGLNIATVDGVHRWQLDHFTPYVGAGIGVNVPHVEVTPTASPSDETFEYQLGGVAAVAFAGVDVPLTDSFSVFGEYKFSYGHVIADLEGGNELSTALFNHHLNVGLSYKFGE